MRTPLSPRKTPIQARSEATVLAIFEATIQVLLQVGFSKLSTTRVSERAGVSIGTLYQYFPDRDALLATVIQHYIEAIGVEVRNACAGQQGMPLSDMVNALVGALVDAKTRREDVSRALHGPMAILDGGKLVIDELTRTGETIQSMLATCADHDFCDLRAITHVLLAGLAGAAQAQLELEATSPGEMKRQLRALAMGYLLAISSPSGMQPVDHV